MPLADSIATQRVLLINPNTTEATTQLLVRTVTPRLPKNVHLASTTARFGARYISCEASHAVAGHALLDAWAAYRNTHPEPLSGVIIGCFGDPGLLALRESAACKVTGLAEASFIEASAFGPFAIVTGGERWAPMLKRLAQNLGFGDALVHIETVKPTGAELAADPAMAVACLSEACQRAAMKPGVRSVILGGAGLAAYSTAVQANCSLPLINSAEAGLRILLRDVLPAPTRTHDAFDAHWHAMPDYMQAIAPVAA
jgi:allantoin racemase